jgi:hypothetical protein
MGLFAVETVSAGTWIATFGPLNLSASDGTARAHGYSFQLPTPTPFGSATTWATPKRDWRKYYSVQYINHTCCKFLCNTMYVPTEEGETVNCKVYREVASEDEFLVNYIASPCKGERLHDTFELLFGVPCECCACTQVTPECIAG